MATPGFPDSGQFGNDPSPPYPVNYQPKPNQVGPSGYAYPPPPPAYDFPQAGFPQNPSNVTISYTPTMTQQTTVVVGNPSPHYVTVGHVHHQIHHHSYTGHMVFACIVFWLCGWLFGIVAFILAVVANSASQKDGKCLGTASLVVSTVGLLAGLVAWGVIIWAIVASVSVTTPDYSGGGGGGSSSSCSSSYYPYYCGGDCYHYKTYSSSASSYYCGNMYTGSTCYSGGYCYHDYTY